LPEARKPYWIGGVVLLAVSDNQPVEAPAQPADLGPVGVAPRGPEWLAIEPASLFEAAHEVPSIITNPPQQSTGRIPRITYDIVRVTTQAMATIARARMMTGM